MYNRHPVKRYQITRSTTTPFKTGFICSNNTKYVSVLRCKVLEITESLIGDAIYIPKIGLSDDVSKTTPFLTKPDIRPLNADEVAQLHSKINAINMEWEASVKENLEKINDYDGRLTEIISEKEHLIEEFNQTHDENTLQNIFDLSKEYLENLLKLIGCHKRSDGMISSLMNEFTCQYSPVIVVGSPDAFAQKFIELTGLFGEIVNWFCKSETVREIEYEYPRILNQVIQMIVQSVKSPQLIKILHEIKDLFRSVHDEKANCFIHLRNLVREFSDSIDKLHEHSLDGYHFNLEYDVNEKISQEQIEWINNEFIEIGRSFDTLRVDAENEANHVKNSIPAIQEEIVALEIQVQDCGDPEDLFNIRQKILQKKTELNMKMNQFFVNNYKSRFLGMYSIPDFVKLIFTSVDTSMPAILHSVISDFPGAFRSNVMNEAFSYFHDKPEYEQNISELLGERETLFDKMIDGGEIDAERIIEELRFYDQMITYAINLNFDEKTLQDLIHSITRSNIVRYNINYLRSECYKEKLPTPPPSPQPNIYNDLEVMFSTEPHIIDVTAPLHISLHADFIHVDGDEDKFVFYCNETDCQKKYQQFTNNSEFTIWFRNYNNEVIEPNTWIYSADYRSRRKFTFTLELLLEF